jgi:hypothetical protein
MRERLVVLGLGQRVDRPQLLAAALQALDAYAQGRGRLGIERLRGRLGLEAKALGEPAQLVGGVALGIADLLGRDLGRRDRFPALAQAPLDVGLLGRARAQGGRHTLARLAIGRQLGVERFDARADRAEARGQRLDELPGRGQQGAVAHQRRGQPLDARGALGPVAGRALGHAALGRQLTLELGAAHGGLALVGSLAALLDEPRRAALLLGGLGACPIGVAQAAIGLVARGVGGLDGAGGGLDRG